MVAVVVGVGVAVAVGVVVGVVAVVGVVVVVGAGVAVAVGVAVVVVVAVVVGAGVVLTPTQANNTRRISNLSRGAQWRPTMPTAYRETPVSQFVKVVDNSTDVNSESRIGTHMVNGVANSSRSAMSAATAGESALPEAGLYAFAVTLSDGTVAMIPSTPAPLPAPSPSHQIIPAGSLMGLRSEYAIDITPKEYLQ